jgi:hypothetical protein
MNDRQTDPLLEWWKTRAEQRREWLDRILSREPATPGQAWKRKIMVERALRSVEHKKTWVDAYGQYLGELRDTFARVAPPNPLSDKGNRGDLGE